MPSDTIQSDVPQSTISRVKKLIRSGKSKTEIKKILSHEKQRKEVISQKIGLEAESALVDKLSQFEKGLVDSKIEQFVKLVNSLYIPVVAEKLSQIIFKFLNQRSIVEKISSLEEFENLLNSLIEIAKLNSSEVSNGSETKFVFWTSEFGEIYKSISSLLRDDPVKDIENISQFMKNFQFQSNKEITIFELKKIGFMVHSSEDLVKITNFINKYIDRIPYSQSIEGFFEYVFGDPMESRNLYFEDGKNSFYHSSSALNSWSEIIKNSEKLDQTLDLIAELINLNILSSDFNHKILRKFIEKLDKGSLGRLKTYISLLKDRKRNFFNKGTPEENEAYYKSFQTQIFNFLSTLDFEKDLSTPKDFYQKVEFIYALAEGIFNLNADTYEFRNFDLKSLEYAYNLTEGNFEKLKILIDALNKNNSYYSEGSLSESSQYFFDRKEGILITLDLYSSFIKDPLTFEIICNHFAKNNNAEDNFKHLKYTVFYKYQDFKEQMTSESLKDIIYIFDSFLLFNKSELINSFINITFKDSNNNTKEFLKKIRTIKELCIKGISPVILYQNYILSDENFAKFNLTQEGLNIFPKEEKFTYIYFCIENLNNLGENSSIVFKFINEALNSSDIDLQEKTKSTFKSEIRRLLITFNIQTLVQISENISGAKNLFDEVNYSFHFENNSSIYNLVDKFKLIENINNKTLNLFFPDYLTNLRHYLVNEFKSNLDLADCFLNNLDNLYQEPWVGEALEIIVNSHDSLAFKYSSLLAALPIWKNETWVYEIEDICQAIYNKQNAFDTDSWGVEGFSPNDPYRDHVSRITSEQLKVASFLNKIICGENIDEEIIQAKVNIIELKKLLSETNKIIEKSFQDFLKLVVKSSYIPEQEKFLLISPNLDDIKMTPLLSNVKIFVARLLSQSMMGDLSNLSRIYKINDDLPDLLKVAFERYLNVYEYDIPYYDKLYEEFDEMRENKRYPLEVYLGRDGIYAFIGRRAIDLARQRKLGREERIKLKKQGEIVAIKPKYIVYPRYFRDSLTEEVKREYLEQENVIASADPIFYDTGYSGTIPHQILYIMGFRGKEIDQRMKLLSAQKPERMVRGMPSDEGVRSHIVTKIEHNVKLEESAEGLFKEDSTQKITPIAMPTAIEEQFCFMFVRQAIARHYWYQELIKQKL